MASPVKPSDFQALISDPNSTMCENFVKTLLRLPVAIYQFLNWFLDSNGDLSSAVLAAISDFTIKPGDLIFSASPLDEVGRLMCNGQSVLRASYPRLFAKIGTTYGSADGTHFSLPDYRDRFPVGVSGTKVITATGGAATVSLIVSNIPAHTHEIGLRADAGGSDAFYARMEESDPDTADEQQETSSVGDSPATPVNIQNPYLACYIYCKT